jgi:maltose alpha-D-glucosyltransferase/alpha-amylase
LGQRTAELHVALASSTEPEFVPEPFTLLYQRSLYQSMRNHAGQIFLRLRKRLNTLPGGLADDVLSVLDAQHVLIDRFRGVLSARISAQRTRIVGDFHLGQVLYTGKDYYIIDLEGERSRPLSERRLKRTPLRDVASMLRSFQYAAYTSLFGHLGSATVRPEDLATLEPWARVWTVWVSSAFLNSYIEHAERGGFLPPDPAHIRLLLETYLLERALYELGYELHYRPEWIRIPLIGIQQILQSQKAAA